MTTYIITFCAISQEIEAINDQTALDIFCQTIGYNSAKDAHKSLNAEMIADRVYDDTLHFVVTLSTTCCVDAEDEEKAKATFIQESGMNLAKLPAVDYELIAERV